MIYFIQAGDDGPIKIGFAKTVRGIKRRLAGFQTCHAQDLTLLGYVEGTRDDEGEYHSIFAESHVRGEWFHPTVGLLDAARYQFHARDLLDLFQTSKRLKEWRMLDVSGLLTESGVEYVRLLERWALDEGWDVTRARDLVHEWQGEAF